MATATKEKTVYTVVRQEVYIVEADDSLKASILASQLADTKDADSTEEAMFVGSYDTVYEFGEDAREDMSCVELMNEETQIEARRVTGCYKGEPLELADAN